MKRFHQKLTQSLNRGASVIMRYKVLHVFFWMAYFTFWVWVYKGLYQDINQLFWVTAFYTVSNAWMYYISQYLLIPRLLNSNKPILFILSFIILASVLSVFMYFGISLALAADLRRMFSASFIQIFMIYFSSNIFTGAILLSVKGFFAYRKNLRREELKEKERIESELNFLKSQVNPHFLFNAINSVYVLIKIDPDKASETLIKLSNLLRSQLYEFTTNNIDIQQELEYVENYIELEKIRKGERLQVVFERGEGLKNFSIAPLLLIPFLENCFKHLSSYKDRANIVKVKIDFLKGDLSAYFYNTKENGQKKKTDQTVGGIGLKNIQRRLELQYPKRHQLKIQEHSDFFEVKLLIKTDSHED